MTADTGSTGAVSTATIIAWLTVFRDLVTANNAYLTELDSAIGDADHGSNMTRGMDAVVAQVGSVAPESIAELFTSAGMTLVKTVGGASGPLYGTFFLRCGSATPAGATQLDSTAFGTCLRAGLEGVVARGKAQAGDKTMFDAMAPALAAYDQTVGRGASLSAAGVAAAVAAATGRDNTEPLVAKKGRASYLGDRSVGHIDPGSASTTLLFEALARALSDT
ncbi:MAG: dihydroxyacetone kinase subunit L [Candidatus Lumbricidophila eiseniae]|uniref:Dihydroxyacetone kinase subunit L n=1 Tax=Candidatus Lumbricidiphila eiseniae TaxID=1969409 RepID=A0A2A6FNV7_9MICO|nr:MAG: dihydroxyacetone kinase subunit L [Candidatus Lumbricidophila eiseniae]